MHDYFDQSYTSSDLRGQALKGAGVTFFIQTCTYIISTIGAVILARLLTPHDFGLVTMVLSFSMVLQNLGPNGFLDATVQRKNLTHTLASTMFWINVGLNFSLMLVFMCSAPLIAWFYREPILKPIVVGMSFTILFACLGTQHQALLLRRMKFLQYSACDLGGTLISSVIAILLAYHGWGYRALMAKWVIAPFTTSIGAWILCRWKPGLPSRTDGVRPMLGFSFNAYGNFVVVYSRRTIDKVLLGLFQGSGSLGNYDRAFSLSNMLPNQLVGPLNSVAMTSFSKLVGNPEGYRQAYLEVLSILAFVCMPLSAVLTLVGKDLILLLIGPQWNEAGRLFCFFGLGTGIMVLYSTHSWLHLSLGTTDRWLRWGIVASIVTVLCLLAGLKFGAAGVALGFSASFYILIGPALQYAGKPIQLRLSSVLAVVWKHSAAALIAGLFCWFIFYKYDPVAYNFEQTNLVLRVLFASLLCISIYLLASIVLHRGTEPISRFFSIVREMMPKRSVGE